MGQLDRSRKILIVDDHEDAAAMVADILLLHGHQAHFAIGGYAGLCAAEAFCPEVVILDLKMPGCDGYSVARNLRVSYADRPLRLIALTAWGDDFSLARARAAGFDAHLVKPAPLRAIVESIEL